MEPSNPGGLEAEGKNLPPEGMNFGGDKGKILRGFRNEKPRLIPESRMKDIADVAEDDPQRSDDVWIEAFRNKQQSPGSFLLAGPVSETINLGAVALRAKKKVMYDASKMEITNVPEANKFLTREYRPGWEM